MSFLDRALRMGEAKKFKDYEAARRADQRLRGRARALHRRRAARGGRCAARARPRRRAARRPAVRVLRARARGRQALARDAPLRRPADRRDGAPRRRDRRDEDRRGQDADRDAGRRAQLARRPRRAPGHRQRLPGPARRDVDEADLRHARRHRRRAAEHAALRGEARRVRRRRHLRHQLRVRLRLPARQHGQVAGGEGPARRAAEARGGQVAVPHLRDRRRGRQHPDRRGAHAADHLGRARAGRRPVREVRPAGAAGWSPARRRRGWTRA